MEIIGLKEVLAIIHSGEIFSCEGVRYDKKRKTGGQLFELAEARKIHVTGKRLNENIENLSFDVEICAGGIGTGIVEKIHADLLIRINFKEISL